MKSTTLFVTALTVLTSAAQDTTINDLRSQLPSCSLSCLIETAKEFKCGIADLPCQCPKLEDMTKFAAPCLVRAGCDLDQITNTAGTIVKMCVAYEKENGPFTLEAVSASATGTQDGPSSTASAETTAVPAGAASLQHTWMAGAIGLLVAAMI